ncbi:ABC transporter permease [Ferrimonas aestuarii]|uniref:ABC transporter permease n=1 Tax=Ferrimonas aestuarii TaxID=2569539 RepID=A0A4U1BRB5_9GAMM|nr:ABC transporter permease [Ferrimonas aestuarii]TKB55464.1 ABC transporter permease [Ferrimonas aestuarii]
MNSVYWAEVRQEVRLSMRGPLFPIVSVGLALYILLILASSGQMQSMGATGIPRNASYLVFQLASGMSMWLFFIWAWVFGQAVLRDRGVSLHEVVLAAPVTLWKLMLARFVGACVVALMLGAIMPLSLFLTPVLAWTGLIAADLVGPAPVLATLWSVAVFIVPTMLGMGALFFVAALRRRSIAGPFAVATIMMLVWMIGLVVLRGGDISDFAATLFDPTAFSEAERQTTQWTPSEKLSSIMTVTPALLLNRLIWAGVPMLMLAWQLWRLTREQLLQPPASKAKAVQMNTAPQPSTSLVNLGAITRSNWLNALWLEARWFWKTCCMSRGTLLALAVLIFIGVLGSITHVVQHGEGPLTPHAPLLMPFMAEFFLLFLMFSIAGFVGMLMQRDRVAGISEIIDACSAPVATRVMGRVVAAVLLTALFSLAPAVSAWTVMGLSDMAINWWDPLLYQVVVVLPAMLEVCAVAVVAHCVLRHAGAAHGVTMMLCFIAVANMEVQVVNYPPGRFALPAEVNLSALDGWSPWLPSLLTLDLFKLSMSLVLIAMAWLAWPRGVDLNVSQRVGAMLVRWRQGAWVMVLLALSTAGISGTLLYSKMVQQGEYQSLADSQQRDAAWERLWWTRFDEFELSGGEVEISLSPRSRTGHGRWTLHHVRTGRGSLTGSLPHGVIVDSVQVDNKPVSVQVAEDQFWAELGDCPESGCEVVIELRLRLNDWPSDGTAPWLTAEASWLTAAAMLPTLGLNPERRLQAPRDRKAQGLPIESSSLPIASLQSDLGVAPTGRWRWQVKIEQGHTAIVDQGEVNGPLTFSSVWLSEAPMDTEVEPLLLHQKAYQTQAQAMSDDVNQVTNCVSSLLGEAPEVNTLIQSPRNSGPITLYGTKLWVPGDLGWDAGSAGVSRSLRRARIAAALAKFQLGLVSDARAEPGVHWLLQGAPNWVGLECVRRLDGEEAWLALLQWHGDHLTDALGKLEVPITRVGQSGNAPWLPHYGALAMTQASALVGDRFAQELMAIAERLRCGSVMEDAVAQVLGTEMAEGLMGSPMISDLAVDASADAKVSIRRWRWQQGGWQLAEAGHQVMVPTFVDAANVQPVSSITAADGSVLLDAAPFPERTMSDNRWRQFKMD